MGERVGESSRSELARARRLRRALESGAPAAFLPPETPSSGNGDGSQNSGLLPPGFLSLDNPSNSDARLQFLEQMFQAFPDALSIADCSHRVLWANETFSLMFGYRAEEMIGQPLENFVVPPDKLAESRWMTETLARGERIAVETRRKTKNGVLLEVSVSCAPLLLDGTMAGYYAGYRDISDRKRVEALSSALYRVAERSSSAHDLHQFFASVHSIVDELIYARNFYIALFDPTTELLSFPYFVDQADAPPSPKKLGRGLTDYLIRTGEPLLATPEVLQAMEDRGEVERSGARSLDWMGVPLKVNSHTFGALMQYGFGVFTRVPGAGRGPVRSMTGLSVANMAREREQILPEMDAHIREQYAKRLRFWLHEAMAGNKAKYERKGAK